MTTLPDLIARAHLNPNGPDALAALARGLQRAGHVKPDHVANWCASHLSFSLGEACRGIGDAIWPRAFVRESWPSDQGGAMVSAVAPVHVTRGSGIFRFSLDVALHLSPSPTPERFNLTLRVAPFDARAGEPWQVSHMESINPPEVNKRTHLDIAAADAEGHIAESLAKYIEHVLDLAHRASGRYAQPAITFTVPMEAPPDEDVEVINWDRWRRVAPPGCIT